MNYGPATADSWASSVRWSPPGCPATGRCIVTVPRQSGKSTVAQAFIKAAGEDPAHATVVWDFEDPG